jgi:hypothetical protein
MGEDEEIAMMESISQQVHHDPSMFIFSKSRNNWEEPENRGDLLKLLLNGPIPC